MTEIFGQVNDFSYEYAYSPESVSGYSVYYADEYISLEQSNDCHVFREIDKRFAIVFDGSIYNIAALKMKLREHHVTFETESEWEVLLKLYQLEEENMVHYLRGMFTFAIWDKQEKTLFAARDPFGIKPFYYREIEKGLWFSSEQTALYRQETDELSTAVLQHYLTFQYVPGKDCLVKGVQSLKPGHYLIKRPGEDPETHEYYHVNFHVNASKDLETSIQQTREALEESVYAHMPSDQSIGAYLSGGIDSASILALARQYHPHIPTFTFGFEREGYSEIDLAEETANELGVTNIQKVITPEEVIQELPNIIWYMGSPVADPAAIPNYFLAKEASEHVDVALSGEGADELFGGYAIYRESESLKLFNYMPTVLQRVLNWLSRLLPEGVKGKVSFGGAPHLCHNAMQVMRLSLMKRKKEHCCSTIIVAIRSQKPLNIYSGMQEMMMRPHRCSISIFTHG